MWWLIGSIVAVALFILLAPFMPWPKEPVTEDEIADEKFWGWVDTIRTTLGGFFGR